MYEKELAAYFETHKEEFIKDLAALVAIPSVKGSPFENCPYGTEPAKALAFCLSIAEQYGLYTENWNNYVGIVQPEAGHRALDVLAHLDVVAAGNAWSITEPFNLKEVDGKVYGRGTADDKGPALAALYALRAIKDLKLPLSKGVRLVLGTDEESGSSDLAHYFKNTAPASMSFSPDAVYPVINVEKGRLGGSVTGSFSHDQILSIHGGHTSNIIPDSAEAVINHVDIHQLDKAAASYGIDYTIDTVDSAEEGQKLKVSGVAGHAASPEDAVNPITALLQLLAACTECEEIQKLSALFPYGAHHGEGLQLDLEDETSGNLTLSLTILNYDGHNLSAYFDSRLPVCCTTENLQTAGEIIDAAGFSHDFSTVAPHSVPGDTPFVRTLLETYENYSGREGQTIAIGGGTYAHGIENAVAFGCAFGGVDNHMHGADEFAEISTLMMSCNIFAQAILKLCGTPSPLLPEAEAAGTILWLQQPDSPDHTQLFQKLNGEGFAVVPVIVDKTDSKDANIALAKSALADIQNHNLLTAAPVAVAGVGYGGFIAGHLLAESDTFSAGTLISGLTNPATAYGTCRGVTLSGSRLSPNFSLMDYLSELTKESVVYHCDAIHTPLLLLHGYRDEVYGFEQAEQLFTSIKERQPQADIRMIVFPKGNDRLAEDADCREAYFTQLTAWFSKHLKGEK